MSRKTSGIDDLIHTLVRQHGVEEAYWRAVKMCRETNDKRRSLIWLVVKLNLLLLRSN